MPQEFNILRCYSCHLFQVHFVKKEPKWSCKVCSEKQSLKQVFFRWTIYVDNNEYLVTEHLAGESLLTAGNTSRIST